MPAKWIEVNLIGVEGEKKQGNKKKKRENRKKEIIERKEK